MKRTVLNIIFATLLILCIGCASDLGTESQTKSQQIDSLFQSRFQQDLFHGGVVISNQAEILYEKYFGIADRSWNIPFEKNTKLDIASVNKSMIAALVLKAVEEEKLNLEDRLIDLLSEFSYEGRFHPDITLHHLLSHSSGLPDYGDIPDELQQDQFLKFKRLHFSNESYVNFISSVEPINSPGKQFYYSNFAYHLVTIILENVYEMPFGNLLEEKLTRPLGLTHTLSESNNRMIVSNLAEAYSYQAETDTWVKNPFIDLSLGRRIFSTPHDLQRWAQVMDTPGWLTNTSLDLMKQNHLSDISTMISYGYGWVIFDGETEINMGNLNINLPYIVHGGSTDGYKAMLININSGEYIISFLSNVGNRTQEMQLAQKLTNILIE